LAQEDADEVFLDYNLYLPLECMIHEQAIENKEIENKSGVKKPPTRDYNLCLLGLKKQGK